MVALGALNLVPWKTSVSKSLSQNPLIDSAVLRLLPATRAGLYASVSGATPRSDSRGSSAISFFNVWVGDMLSVQQIRPLLMLLYSAQAGRMLSVQQIWPSVNLPPPLSKNSHVACTAPHFTTLNFGLKNVHSTYGFDVGNFEFQFPSIRGNLFNVLMDCPGSCTAVGYHCRAQPPSVGSAHAAGSIRPAAPGSSRRNRLLKRTGNAARLDGLGLAVGGRSGGVDCEEGGRKEASNSHVGSSSGAPCVVGQVEVGPFVEHQRAEKVDANEEVDGECPIHG